MARAGRIRIGIGGWNYEPWRGLFYPEGLARTRELEYASRQVTAIEINSTFYRTQAPATFEKWRDETPTDFKFAVKAPRYATHRKVLAEAGEAVDRFMASGLLTLGGKLGPVLWQFAPTKRFDPHDFEPFLALLAAHPGVSHVVEPRHASFLCAEYIELARRYGVATAYTDSAEYPSYADVTSDVVYARLMRSQPSIDTGYASTELDVWARRARAWAGGEQPPGLPYVAKTTAPLMPRDVYIFMIDGAKERAPAAARALIARL